jgi:hypothetical protein
VAVFFAVLFNYLLVSPAGPMGLLLSRPVVAGDIDVLRLNLAGER